MEERPIAPTCDRGNDLIAFLYGESDEREARDFERHLRSCARCGLELSSFREIRESIGVWRQDSLAVLPELAAHGTQAAALRTSESVRPSALAAIRAFFDLSPLWMKGAVAFASILFCVVAALAMFRLMEKPEEKPESAISSNPKIYSEADMKLKVAEALAKQQADAPDQKASDVGFRADNVDQPRPQKTSVTQTRATANKPQRRPLTKAEREQLAADLRLISPDDDAELELIDDRINR